KKSGLTTTLMEHIYDNIIWYAKDISKLKYRQLFDMKEVGVGDTTGKRYDQVELHSGVRRAMTKEEKENSSKLPEGSRPFKMSNPCSISPSRTKSMPLMFKGKEYYHPSGRNWASSIDGMYNLIRNNRIMSTGKNLAYVLYLDDFPVIPITNIWMDLLLRTEKIYVVQTADKVISRCMLMTTDPGDLVLDITCGSGTTAYVAEQWGRRWITCDTSRVAIALAKKRLMTATYDYYKLAHEEQGVASGFVYKTVPHITLKSIANNEPPDTGTLYDQPEVDKTKIRITGPFTVEALPAPVGVSDVHPLDTVSDLDGTSTKQTDWRDELLATGIRGRGGAKIEFSRVEPLSGTKYLQAEAETKEDAPRRAVICFGSETKPLDSRLVAMALDEVENLRPKPKLVVFAAFQFDPEAAKDIDETNWPDLTLLKVQMNTDLMTEDLKKKRSSNESFWLVGQPDAELIFIDKGKDKGKYYVRVNGFDYYDVKKGTVESGNVNRIAMWMLDTNYDGLSIEPMQVFFPMGGSDGGWGKLAKTLRAEINQELIEKYAGNQSLPFAVESNTQIAVKIIDDRGIESLKVIKVGEL
ncbi:MAG: site-specific DNA-methyltransferase, partial [Clostridiales bacterium]|nr:site-specific DNA-methyltransferase [Clostridiales bacterium]